MKRWLVGGASLALLVGVSAAVRANGAPPFRPGPGPRPPLPGGMPAVKAQSVKFSVEIDEKAKEPRLIVPFAVLMGGLAGPGGVGFLGAPPGGFGGIGGGAIGVPPGGFGGAAGVPPGGPGIGGGAVGFGGGALGAVGAPPGGGKVPPGGRVPPGGTRPANPPQPPPDGGDGLSSRPQGATIMAGLALTAAFVSGGFWMVRRGNGRAFLALLIVSGFALGAVAVWADLAPPFPGPRPGPHPVPAPEIKTTPVALPATVEFAGKKVLLEPSFTGDTVRLILPKDAIIKQADKTEKKPAEEK